MTDRELMQQALEALKKCRYRSLADEIVDPAITALRSRLAQPEQEPVAYIEHHKGGDNLVWDDPGGKRSPLYTAPPQRTWVGLTDEEVKNEWVVWRASLPRYVGFAKGIEAKLKEKNA